jgi:fatty-acyl-CoA synthase
VTRFEGPDPGDVEGLGALTLGSFLDEVVTRFGPNEALVLDDPLRGGETVRWSYERLGDEARRIGRALVHAGVQPGDTVATVLGNRPEAVAALFGAALAGAVVAPLSTFAARPELAHMLEKARVGTVLTQERLLGRRFGDELAELHGGSGSLAVLGTDSWSELLTGADDVAPAELATRTAATSPDDPALVIFSSGTTSEPKGILHGHRSPTLQFWVQAQIFGRHAGTRMFSALPLFWTAGLNTAMGSTLAVGGCWVMQETFDAGGALALMSRERVTEPYTLPHQTSALAEHPDWAGTDLSSLRCVYGKSAYARHPSVQGDPHWVMPVGYGLSETCAFVSGHRSDTPRELARVGNGPLLPGTRLRVLDRDSGRDLEVDEEGELAVSGATLMLRYLGTTPEQCLDPQGYFHTGDLGHVDAAGILHYSGRLTEMIKTAGANVSPAEIEVQLRAFEPVKLSRVLGVADERLGQIVVVCIVCKDGRTTTPDEVRAFLRGRIAAYKVPRRVLFLTEDEMPMTGSDTKVRDDALAEIVLQRLADDPDPTTAVPATARPNRRGDQ